MDCAAVKPRMEALVSGSLPPAERSLAEQHIAICEGEWDFVEEMASLPACSPKQLWIASVSSLSLYGVEVPCALM